MHRFLDEELFCCDRTGNPLHPFDCDYVGSSSGKTEEAAKNIDIGSDGCSTVLRFYARWKIILRSDGSFRSGFASDKTWQRQQVDI